MQWTHLDGHRRPTSSPLVDLKSPKSCSKISMLKSFGMGSSVVMRPHTVHLPRYWVKEHDTNPVTSSYQWWNASTNKAARWPKWNAQHPRLPSMKPWCTRREIQVSGEKFKSGDDWSSVSMFGFTWINVWLERKAPARWHRSPIREYNTQAAASLTSDLLQVSLQKENTKTDMTHNHI